MSNKLKFTQLCKNLQEKFSITMQKSKEIIMLNYFTNTILVTCQLILSVNKWTISRLNFCNEQIFLVD